MSRWSYFSNFVEDAGFSFEVTCNDSTMGLVTVFIQPTCSDPQAVVYAEPFAGYHFDHWGNGSTQNPYSLTLTQDTVLTAYFAADQTEGIDEVAQLPTLVVRGNIVTVADAQSQMLSIFDITGRVIVREQAVEGKAYTMPNTGVYMVKVGSHKAEKVVVR